MTYKPDSFVILKAINQDKPFYKVLGGWSGGCLYGDEWRISSGISSYELYVDIVRFHGF